MALTDKLTSIANAIREKGNTTAKLTLDAMPAAIAALEVGGGGSGEDGVPNPILIDKDATAAFRNKSMNWIIENFGDRIQTSNLTSCPDMFSGNTTIENIPFDLNCSISGKVNFQSAFYNCNKLKSISGSINNANIDTMRYMFYGCNNLRELPVINNLTTENGGTMAFGDAFRGCYSLRSIPESLLKMLGNTNVYNVNGTVFNGLSDLYTIDEIVGIPTKTKEAPSNCFSNPFKCYRIKRFVFDTKEDGSPYIVNWKNQTISLYDGFGWLTGNNAAITDFNSGITEDKKITDETNYPTLKDDPDCYTGNVYYSRFNHDSAVELINSLPDASAYLATQSSGTNTIKFRQDAGKLTDGGQIGDLTEEEIAVATAKGWTISFAA